MRYETRPENGEIHCTLETVSIKDTSRLKYAALSYVWNFIPGTEQIFVGRQPMQATNNLVAFLRNHWARRNARQASRNFRLPLWIDAICINQQDLAEKSGQVPLMGDIYRNAKMTFGWLGPGSRDEYDSLTALRGISHRCKAVDEFIGPKLILLGKNPWFGRVWIFQEIILSSDLLLVCGNLELQLKGVLDYLQYLDDRMREPEHWRICSWDDAWSCLWSVDHGFSNLMHAQRVRLALQRGSYKDMGLRQRLQFVPYTRSLRASRPHDKIYGILGLISLPIVPDYTKCASDVLCEVASMMARMKLPDLLLEYSGHSLKGRKSLGLPSWVPVYDEHVRLTECLSSESAPAGLTSTMHSSQTSLYVPGVLCGQVVASYSLSGPDGVRGVADLLQKMASKSATGDSSFAVIMSTLFMARPAAYRRSPKDQALSSFAGYFVLWLINCDEIWDANINNELLEKFGFVDPLGFSAPAFLGWYLDKMGLEYHEHPTLDRASTFDNVGLWIHCSRPDHDAVQTTLNNLKRCDIALLDNGHIGIGPDLQEGDFIYAFPFCTTFTALRKEEDHYIHLGGCFILNMEDKVDWQSSKMIEIR